MEQFTHSQYSFHLTESRLRSNLIGAVQAHDADLNDTLEYSILSGASGTQLVTQEQQCARLFEFANPASGQLSLRMGIRQLNVSQCQLVVQASDTLGPASGRHQQQARVSINVSPQIIGRSINLFAGAADQRHQAGHQSRRPADQRAKQTGPDQGEFSTASSVVLQYQPNGGATPTSGQANQRSSLATVMASLQHMAKGMNFLEMPVSSALLLSVLLAFLVCLLLIVVVSMSVHVYRRRSKTRRRRHLAATAHLRHAHLAAGTPGPGRGPISPYKTSSSSYTSTSTTSASPASSVHSGHLQQQQQAAAKAANSSNHKSRKQNFFDNLGLASSVVEIANRHHQKSNLSAPSSEDEPNGNTNDTSLTTASSAQANGSPTPAGNQSDSREATREPLEELKISTELEPLAADKSKPAPGTYIKSITVPPVRAMNANSLISSLTTTTATSQSNPNSYLGASSLLSTDEDDSSVIQCGHYSVNNTIEHRGEGKQLAGVSGTSQDQASGSEPFRKVHTNRLLDEIHSELLKQQKQVAESASGLQKRKKKKQSEHEQRRQVSSSIEAAIRSLARQEQAVEGLDDEEPANSPPGSERHGNKFKLINYKDVNEVSELTSAGKPGIKSYRQLPLMNSLVRPGRSQLLSRTDRNKVAPEESAAAGQQIRWPSGAVPQRIKKLTWDDELSCGAGAEAEAAGDCYISPDVQLAGPMSPLGPGHQYSAAPLHRPLEYLYSPSSQQNVPRPNYSNYLPALNGQAQEQTSSSSANLHNRNNCLDYTIVQTSQFHADSLMASAGAVTSAAMSSHTTRQLNEPGDYLYSRNQEAPSEHYYYEQTTLGDRGAAGSRAEGQTPTRESGQTGATYKLNQNYQDLKLMTTAVL